MMNNDEDFNVHTDTKVGVSWDEVVEWVDPLFPNHTQLLACSWSSQLPVTMTVFHDISCIWCDLSTPLPAACVHDADLSRSLENLSFGASNSQWQFWMEYI